MFNTGIEEAKDLKDLLNVGKCSICLDFFEESALAYEDDIEGDENVFVINELTKAFASKKDGTRPKFPLKIRDRGLFKAMVFETLLSSHGREIVDKSLCNLYVDRLDDNANIFRFFFSFLQQ